MKLINLKIFINVLLLVFIREASAQVKMFTNDELPSEHIYQITQDNQGFVWFLTEEGMVKYDGTNIKTFTVADGLPTNAIWNSAIAGDRIWYLCKGAEQGYIQNDSVYNFKLDTGYLMPSRLQVKGKEVYLNAVGQGLYEARNGKWHLVNKFNFVYNDTVAYNNLYLPNISHYIIDYKIIDFYNNEKLVLSFPINYLNISSFKVYGDSLMVFTLYKEAYFINTKTLEYTKANIPLKENEKFYGTSIRLINGKFQVSYKNFVGVLDESYNISEYYHIDPKYDAHANMIDKDGNIWLGSFTTGIHFMSKEERFATTKNIENNTYAPIWFEDYIYYVSNGNVETFNSNETILKSDEYIYFSGEVNGKLYYYIDFQKNLFELKNKKKKHIPIYFKGEESKYAPLKILKVKDEYFSLGFSQIQVFNKNFEFRRQYPLVANNIFLVGDSLLVATNNGLFYINKNDQIRPTVMEESVTDLIQIGESLVIGTVGKGLLFSKNGKKRYLSLNNASINSLQLFQDSLLFCATNKGVICLKRQDDLFEPYYNYTRKDGLKSIKTNGVATDNDNNIYITTKKGITKTKLVLPKDKHKKLEKILVKNIVWNKEKIAKTNNIKLLHKKRSTLSLDFKAIYFDVKPNLEYFYKITGEDEEFRKLHNGNLVLYDLPIGKYEIELQIAVPFTEQISKKINIEIKAKWFQTIWFYFGIILLSTIFILLALKKSQELKMQKKMQTLEKEAVLSNFKLLALRSQMNPHFVFNSLNAIQYYITENQNDLSEKYLLSFAKLVRQFFDLSEVGVIKLSTEIDLLTNYLELEKMRFENKLDFNIEVDKKLNLNTTEIPTMLVQPIVENGVNHGVFHKEIAGVVSIDFIFINDNEYKVRIKDDGIGVENSKRLKAKSMQGHQSKSSLIINERIALLNKTNKWFISCTSENISAEKKYPGTQVSLNIKQL